MINNNYKVYMHRNKINNKVYIGITCQKPHFRWGAGSGYDKQTKFYNAIKKYGWNNFEHIIIFNNLTKENAIKKEINLIKKYDAIKNGYNISIGGKGSNGVPCSEDKKIKISKANKGHKFTEEAKKRISNSLKGNIPCNRIKVICVETGIIYESLHEAYNQTKIQYKNIQKVCKKEYGRKTAGGYHWEYYNLNKIEDKKEEEN